MPGTVAPEGYEAAISLFKAGRKAEALPLLERCVEMDASHVGAWFGLGVCLEAAGRSQDAEVAYRRVLAMDTRHLNGHLHLARMLTAQGRPEGSELYRRVLEISPGHTEALRALNPVPAQGAVASAPGTLAAELDDAAGAGQPGSMAGAVLHTGHRRLLSHRRLWVAVALLLVLPLAAAVQSKVAASTTLADPARLLGVLRFLQWTILGVSAVLVGSALLSSALTRYVVRERRIEIERGVLVRTRRPVWLYDINDLEYTQTPIHLLAGTARVTLHVDDNNEKRRSPELVGFGSASFLRELIEDLQPMVLRERRAMKKQFT